MDKKHWNNRIFLYIFFLYFSHISGNELNSLKFLFFGDWGLPGENLTEVVGTMPQLKDTSFLIALGIVGHHPIVSRGELGDAAALQARLLPILQKYGVHAYLNGQDHTLQKISFKGLDFFSSGCGIYFAASNNSAGYWDHLDDIAHGDARFGSLEVGFGEVAESENELKVAFKDRQGNILYSTELTNPRPSASFYVASLPTGQESYWSRTGQDVALFLLGLIVGVAISNHRVQLWLSSFFRRICCCMRCLWPRVQGIAVQSSSGTTASPSTSAHNDCSGPLSQFELQNYSPMSLREDLADLHDEDELDQKERFV